MTDAATGVNEQVYPLEGLQTGLGDDFDGPLLAVLFGNKFEDRPIAPDPQQIVFAEIIVITQAINARYWQDSPASKSLAGVEQQSSS